MTIILVGPIEFQEFREKGYGSKEIFLRKRYGIREKLIGLPPLGRGKG
jgi:hypothetical protein